MDTSVNRHDREYLNTLVLEHHFTGTSSGESCYTQL